MNIRDHCALAQKNRKATKVLINKKKLLMKMISLRHRGKSCTHKFPS